MATAVRTYGLFIDGEWHSARDGKTFAVRNPATPEVISEVADRGRSACPDAQAASRRGRRDHPVELPLQHGHPQAGPGSRGRLHRDPPTGPSDAADRDRNLQ